MLDALWSVVGFILKAINFVLDILVGIMRLQRFGRWIVTGSPDPESDIKVPPDPKILPSAAKRALAEAEERHRNR